MSNALQAIPTDHGLDVLTSHLKETVTTYSLVGALTHDAEALYTFHSNTIETSYFDENGVLTFILDLPIDTHFDEYLHQIQILDDSGEIVIDCPTPKVALAKGIGGMVTLKTPITGESGDVVFKSSEFVTETELKELHLSPYLTRAEWLKQMLFKGLPMSAVGPEPDPDIWLPAGRVELLRADYPTVFEIVSASDFFIDQETIDSNPRLYAGYWGDGDGVSTFTTDDWALMMNIKVAGGYGAAGSTKEGHIENITGEIKLRASGASSGGAVAGTAFEGTGVLSQTVGLEAGANNALAYSTTLAYQLVYFDASNVANTNTYTDSMGLFLDHYRVIPKGTFIYA